MQTEVFWTLLVCLLCTIVLELFLISHKIEDWIEVTKIRQDSLDKMQGIKARYVPHLHHYKYPHTQIMKPKCDNVEIS